jgi:conjugative relaxase-like TrwC/TraI family protein
MKHQVTLGKIYRSALRQQVESLGHEVEETGKNGLWEIKGIPEEVREEYPPVAGKFRGQWGQRPHCAAGMWPRKTRAAQRSIRPACG